MVMNLTASAAAAAETAEGDARDVARDCHYKYTQRRQRLRDKLGNQKHVYRTECEMQ